MLGAGFLIRWNLPLVHPGENMAIGLNPSLDFLFSFVSCEGADAKLFNQSKYGATVGLGYRTGLFTTTSIGYGGLAVMAEVATTSKRFIYQIRSTTMFSSIDISYGTTMFHYGLYFVLTGKI